MGDLPSFRVTPSRLFTLCGVDYAGPILIKAGYGRSNNTMKSYIASFVCFATKAVHIELVSECTSIAFLNVLKCFLSRRGKISHIYSDNSQTFVGANRELINLFNSSNFEALLTH